MMDEKQEKQIINALQGLKHEKAPADFLSQVHARIEKRSQLESIINAIFQPLQIKIPLQLAGVALTIFLIILVNQPNQLQIPITTVPQPSKMAVTAVKPIPLAAKPKKESIKTLAIALAFNEETEGKSSADTDQVTQQSPPAPSPSSSGIVDSRLAMAKTKEEKKDLTGGKGTKDNAVATAPPSCEIDKNWYDQQTNANKIRSDKNFSKLIQLVKEAKGEIILIERQKDSNKPKALAAKIPSTNIYPFLKQVNQLGKITVPAIPEYNGKYIIVRIDISY